MLATLLLNIQGTCCISEPLTRTYVIHNHSSTPIFTGNCVNSRNVKVNLSLYTHRGSKTLRVSRQSANEVGKVVSPRHRPPLPPGNIPGTHFSYIPNRPQGHSATGRIESIKCSKTPSGIEHATFRLVAQCLNQLHHRVPPGLYRLKME